MIMCLDLSVDFRHQQRYYKELGYKQNENYKQNSSIDSWTIVNDPDHIILPADLAFWPPNDDNPTNDKKL